MPKCSFCDHSNPVGSAECGKCGAALDATQRVDATQVSPPGATADTTPLDSELLALLRAGKKIEAIKRYREATGQGLLEAKNAVEALAAEHKIAQMSGNGCGTSVLLVLAVLVLLGISLQS